MIDVVIPRNNEKEFLSMAEKLGYSAIFFLYKTEKEMQTISSDKITIKKGILTNNGGQGKYPTFMHSGEKDQHSLEHNPPTAIFGCEAPAQKDYLHQRASGLNHILCTYAHKNKVIIAFSFNDILMNKNKRAQILGRLMQNIHLCRKYKVMTAIASFATTPLEMRAPSDLQSLFVLLGMHPAETKKSMEILKDIS